MKRDIFKVPVMRLAAVWISVLWAFVAGVADASAKTYTIDQVPNPREQNTEYFVSNPDGILSPGTVARINDILARLERTTGAEVAIVVLESVEGGSPEDFSVRLFEKWGIGKKGSDNGLLILLATGDRFVRFEVGYGLEGVITDALSKRIQTQRMNPSFSEGDWDGGMLAGVEAVYALLADPDSELSVSLRKGSDEGGAWVFIVFVFLGIVIMSLLAAAAARRKPKCPRCGHKMNRGYAKRRCRFRHASCYR